MTAVVLMAHCQMRLSFQCFSDRCSEDSNAIIELEVLEKDCDST